MNKSPMALHGSFLPCILLLVGIFATSARGLGVNWGTQSTHQLPPKTVVQLLKDNGIQKVKLFDADFTVLSSLAGTGIEVMVAIPNDMLSAMTVFSNAQAWVKSNITRYNWDGGVNIKYVAVGNEPFLTAYNGSFVNITFPALQNIQRALNEAGAAKVKATIPLNADVYGSPSNNPVPSAGQFRSDITELMTQVVQFLNQSDAQFTVNIYPFLSLYGNPDFPVSYAFFDGGTTIDDNGVLYSNVFDANFDTLVSSLKAIGFGDLPVIIGEVGWPTDGDINANSSFAQRFYSGILARLAGNVGTPLRPNTHIETYLFSLLDEDAKSIAPGDFERHWGIFTYDGKPKYPVNLSGTNTFPTAAENVEYLPSRWCVLNPNSPAAAAGNSTKLAENVDYACTFADCTALGYGSSCNDLDKARNASYAFNMYFQAQNQKQMSCDFQGLAMVTVQNYSQGSCEFIIQLASASSMKKMKMVTQISAYLLILAFLF